MKPPSSFSPFLIIFIFTTLTLNSPISTADESDCDKFVCDTNWDHIKSGQPYRFGTPLLNQGGDIILKSTLESKPCPRNAIILDHAGDNFIITPTVHTDDGLVPLETPFSISSGEKNDGSCNENGGYLKITRKDKKVKFWRVTADGDFNTSASCFQFVKFPLPTDLAYTPTYMLQNCPWKCGELLGDLGKKKKCFQIGNRTADGYQYLANNGYPFEFAIKGNDDDDSSGYLYSI